MKKSFNFYNCITVLLFIVTIPFVLSSSSNFEPVIEWEKTYGDSIYETGLDIQQTADNGYIIVGFRGILLDIYLIKTDFNGNLQWNRTYGGSGEDLGWSVQQTTDGGYIISGRTTPFGSGEGDVYLIKTDFNGNKQWEKAFGWIFDDGGRSVLQSSDGGYVVACYVYPPFGTGFGFTDVLLVKTDFNGNLQWNKTLGGSVDDEGYSLQKTSDNGYIIVGKTFSFGGRYNVYLIKTDFNGNKQWEKTFGGSIDEEGRSVQQTTDGGYVIAGSSKDTFGTGKGKSGTYLIKTDSNGNLQWERIFGGSGDYYGRSVQQTTDGGFIIAGYNTSFYDINANDVYLIKTDSNGNLQWNKTFGGNGHDKGFSIQKTSDGGYVVVGETTSFGSGEFDVYLIKLKQPSCNDSIKNQDETDIDCGGSCGKCMTRKSCIINSDCQSNFCYNNICRVPTCKDSIKNGYEEGIDCGWACGNSCGKCVPVVNNGNTNDKIDVVFIGSGFPNLEKFSEAVNDSIDYYSNGHGLMYYEPFKSYKNRFNFWRVNELRNFSNSTYETDSEKLAKESCPQLDDLILLSVDPRFVSHAYVKRGVGLRRAFITIGCENLGSCPWPLDIVDKGKTKFYGSSKEEVIRTVVHEFGHSFGGLHDEYDYGINSSTSIFSPNCDNSSCSKWNSISGTGCIQKCGYSNWYRSFPNTLMRSQYDRNSTFKLVNEIALRNNIETLTPLTLLTVTQLESYNLSYVLGLGYNNENISFNDIKLVPGKSAIPADKGNYLLRVKSFNNNELLSFNFDFSLEAAYASSSDWFDVNGNQIIIPNESAIKTKNETNESFVIPYFPNARSIEVYDINNNLIINIDISQYHDLDLDKIVGVIDNCRLYNPNQEDANDNTIGDACEIPPNPPINLIAKPINNLIGLTWRDNSSDEQGFIAERVLAKRDTSSLLAKALKKLIPIGNWTIIANIPANSTTFQDNNINIYQDYLYRVKAFNSYGNSSYSNIANAKIPATCTDSDGGNNIYINGTVVSNAPRPYYTSFTDYCHDSSGIVYVKEAYCGSDGLINTVSYKCPNQTLGCLNGACIR